MLYRMQRLECESHRDQTPLNARGADRELRPFPRKGRYIRRSAVTTGEDLRYDISDQIAEICCCRRRLCAGGGMTLAISCDVLVAGRSASFGYPEVDLGFVPAIRCGWGALLSYVS